MTKLPTLPPDPPKKVDHSKPMPVAFNTMSPSGVAPWVPSI